MTIDNEFLKKLREIQVQKSPMSRTIKDLLNEFQSTKIRIPEYQRSFVWERDKQCRFIESIFLQVPIPPIFFLEKYDHIDEENGLETMVYEVIDGVQRLTTLANFDSGKLTLSGLERLQDLNQAKLSQLPLQVREFFLGRQIDVICIQSGTNPEVQFEVFGRLNQGSVALNAQELRNCMFHGRFNDFLIDCSRNLTYRELLQSFPKFNKPLDGKPDKNRMQDVELILRFFTLLDRYDSELNKYPEPRTETLNEYMRGQIKKDALDEDSLTLLDGILTNALKLVRDVFYPDHFRSFIKKADQASFTKTLSQSVFDVQMLGFLDLDPDLVSQHTEIIKETFIDLCCYNKEFADSIARSTNTKVSQRLSIWRLQLADLLTCPEPYYEKLNRKKELFTENSACIESGISISSLTEGDIYEGQLYHRSSLSGNDIFSPPQERVIYSRRTRNSPTSFTMAGQPYETNDLKEAVELILDFIHDEIIRSNDEAYHWERIQSLDFCGSSTKLSQLNSPGNSSVNQLIQIRRGLYFRMGTRSETVERVVELASLFSFTQPFEMK